MNRSAKFLTLLALVLALIAPCMLSAQSKDQNADKLEKLQRQLDEMNAQMRVVQAQINELSGGARAPASHIEPAVMVETKAQKEQAGEQQAVKELGQGEHKIGETTSKHETFAQDQVAAPRIDNEPLDPRYPGYFKIPGTGTFLKIGGYFKTDFIRDIRQAGEPEKFVTSSIPINPGTHVTNSTVSVRPTRLNLDFMIPTEALGKVRFYVEGDLFGSNATTPRMRHAYAQAKNFLIGQTFSNFMDPDSGPDQLEFQGPNGQVSIRSPQLRYGIPLSKKASLAFSAEKAGSDVAFATPEFSALPSNPMPDITAKFRYDAKSGHVQASAIFRDVAAFLPNGNSDSVFGWGFNITGLQKSLGLDTFTYQLAYGRGIERYLNDTSGLGIDAAPISAAEPRLRALAVLGAYGSYQHFWAPKIRTNVIYGFVQADNTPFQKSSVFHQSNYAGTNLIWNVAGSLHVGAEFLYGWVVKKDGSTGNAPRIMISAKYNFVKPGESKK